VAKEWEPPPEVGGNTRYRPGATSQGLPAAGEEPVELPEGGELVVAGAELVGGAEELIDLGRNLGAGEGRLQDGAAAGIDAVGDGGSPVPVIAQEGRTVAGRGGVERHHRGGGDELAAETDDRVIGHHLSVTIRQVAAVELLQQFQAGQAHPAGDPPPKFLQAPGLVELLVPGGGGEPAVAGNDDELAVAAVQD
jgi:hypothetical protein